MQVPAGLQSLPWCSMDRAILGAGAASPFHTSRNWGTWEAPAPSWDGQGSSGHVTAFSHEAELPGINLDNNSLE